MANKNVHSVIHADGIDIAVVTSIGNEDDYISLTDIAKYHNPELPGYVIQNWMRNRSTIEFLGLWEKLNNPQFNCLEFEAITDCRKSPVKAGLFRQSVPDNIVVSY